MRTECGIAIFGTAAEENGARRTIREAKRMKSIRHGLVILTDASRCGDGGENANEKNNQGFGAERLVAASVSIACVDVMFVLPVCHACFMWIFRCSCRFLHTGLRQLDHMDAKR
jgi:hypothetical protein